VTLTGFFSLITVCASDVYGEDALEADSVLACNVGTDAATARAGLKLPPYKMSRVAVSAVSKRDFMGFSR